MSENPSAGQTGRESAPPVRIFLVVVDNSAEMSVALAYACRRARKSGGKVALLTVIEPTGFQEWRAVEERMRAERRAEAEQAMLRHAKEVTRLAGSMPVIYIREGDRREELLALIAEEPTISILILAAGTGPEGPGPLISYLSGSAVNRLRVPLTIVPGTLREDQLDAVT
jgi:nucleotide-binding universal stress UspA family protein